MAGTDWTALRLEYVNSTITLRALADKHGIKAAGVMRRAANEGWDAERKQRSAEVSEYSQTALTDERASELAQFNRTDLQLAKAIRVMVARRIERVSQSRAQMKSAELATLARAVETAQKIGRLALGAATENTVTQTKMLPASVDEFL